MATKRRPTSRHKGRQRPAKACLQRLPTEPTQPTTPPGFKGVTGEIREHLIACKARFVEDKKRIEKRRRDDPQHRGRTLYSQADVAHEIGIDPSDLSKAFNLKGATSRTLCRIFEYYNAITAESDPLLRLEYEVSKLGVINEDARGLLDKIADAYREYMTTGGADDTTIP